jgi:hypothetical protein
MSSTKEENDDVKAGKMEELLARIEELEKANDQLVKDRDANSFAKITAEDVYGNLKRMQERMQDNLMEKYSSFKSPELDLTPWIKAAAASRGKEYNHIFMSCDVLCALCMS